MNDMKAKTGALLKEMAVLTGAVAIIAAGVYFFLVPSHTSVSSISGLGHRVVQCCAAALVGHYDDQKLMNFIRKTDPDAFVTVYAVSEMMYKPKVIK